MEELLFNYSKVQLTNSSEKNEEFVVNSPGGHAGAVFYLYSL